jgi:hypothetical protein
LYLQEYVVVTQSETTKMRKMQEKEENVAGGAVRTDGRLEAVPAEVVAHGSYIDGGHYF